MSWLPPSDGWLSITDTVALSYEIGWLRHRRIFSVKHFFHSLQQNQSVLPPATNWFC